MLQHVHELQSGLVLRLVEMRTEMVAVNFITEKLLKYVG